MNDVDLLSEAVAGGEPRAFRSVKADGMDLVEIKQGAVTPRAGHEIGKGRDIPAHGIETFAGDQFRLRSRFLQQGFEMRDIVMAEDAIFGAGIADAGDHRGMIFGIGKDDETGNLPAERAETGEIGGIAGTEDERRRLAVPSGKSRLQADKIVAGAGNVARAAGASAAAIDRFPHRRQNRGMLAQSQIIVAAPKRHFDRRRIGRFAIKRLGKSAA